MGRKAPSAETPSSQVGVRWVSVQTARDWVVSYKNRNEFNPTLFEMWKSALQDGKVPTTAEIIREGDVVVVGYELLEAVAVTGIPVLAAVNGDRERERAETIKLVVVPEEIAAAAVVAEGGGESPEEVAEDEDSIADYGGDSPVWANDPKLVVEGTTRIGPIVSLFEWITPTIAAEILERNRFNRRCREARIARYATTMASGRWRLTSQAISIDRDGNLIDGQHRLRAIVESGCDGIWFLVCRGFDPSARLDMDQGGVRNDADKWASVTSEQLGYDFFATARRMRVGPVNLDGSASSDELIAFVARHHEALDYALKHVVGTFRHSSIRGAVARAYAHVRRPALDRFCELLCGDGLGLTESERAVSLLRNSFMKGNGKWGSLTARTDLYQKTQNAIKHFAARSPVKSLVASTADLFPLPSC